MTPDWYGARWNTQPRYFFEVKKEAPSSFLKLTSPNAHQLFQQSTAGQKASIMTPQQRHRPICSKICSALLLLLLCLLAANFLPGSHAQDPIYRVIPVSSSYSSSRPWSNQPHHSYRTRGERQRAYRPPASTIAGLSPVPYLTWQEFQRDPRAREYSVSWRSRKPNQHSITSRLVALTCACFALQVWRPSVTLWGMKLSEPLRRGEQLYRLVTPMFLHGGIFHLFMNMGSLGRVGNDVEKLFGPGRYLSAYTAAGIAGNVMSAWFSPNPSLGASGAVFGIVGAYFTFLNRNEWLLGSQGQAMTSAIVQTMATNLLFGLFVPNIDQWAHLGGALAGAGMAYVFGPRLYMVDLPIGGGRILVDKPIARAPAYVEKVPQVIGNSWLRFSNQARRQLGRLISPNGSNPWQSGKRQINYYQRRSAPNRSIKPGDVDD